MECLIMAAVLALCRKIGNSQCRYSDRSEQTCYVMHDKSIQAAHETLFDSTAMSIQNSLIQPQILISSSATGVTHSVLGKKLLTVEIVGLIDGRMHGETSV